MEPNGIGKAPKLMNVSPPKLETFIVCGLTIISAEPNQLVLVVIEVEEEIVNGITKLLTPPPLP
jgi:hypothetical protein